MRILARTKVVIPRVSILSYNNHNVMARFNNSDPLDGGTDSKRKLAML